MQNYSKIKIKPIHLVVISFVAILVILIVFSVQHFINQNPYGPELKIDNFSSYFKNVPKNVQSAIFANLYQTAAINVPEGDEVPTSGALVQKDSANTSFEESDNYYANGFIVDVEPIKQSFKVFFKWSTKSNNPNMGGDSIIITCLTGANSTYKSTYCQDNTGQGNKLGKLLDKNPIVTQLPILVSEYNKDYTKYINYKIHYRINDDETKIILIITDYTGGNRAAAIKKLQDLGYNTENYEIEYIDDSGTQIPGRAPGAF